MSQGLRYSQKSSGEAMNNQEVNGRRAARGRAIVHTNERYGNNTDDLGNVLLDLMHYARVDGRDFAKELAKSLPSTRA